MNYSKRIEDAEAAVQARKAQTRLNTAGAVEWLRAMFPGYVCADFADHHLDLLEWAWEIESDKAPRPFICIWPRGGAKSTLTEIIVAALGLRGKRRYCLYCSETQQQADQHVQSIAGLLESKSVDEAYPEHGERRIGKHGNARGWRRNRVATSGGFVVDALGLDVAARGAKIDEHRPDVIVLDDVDSESDTPRTTQKKLDLITRAILPAGTKTAAVIGAQNLITPEGIFAQLSDGRADFLSLRIVSGPIPAIREMKTERVYDEEMERFRDMIRSGVPTWAGQDIEVCQETIDRTGLSSFLVECQHDVFEKPGALWTRRMLAHARIGDAPELKRIAIGVDPSGGRAEIGIIAGGLGNDGKGYVLRDATKPGADGPRAWAVAVVELYYELSADVIVVEKNYGGDMCEANIRAVDPAVNIKMVTASRGKALRAEPVASLYGTHELEYADSCVHHVGTFPELEQEMCGWSPGDPSPNRLDAHVWAFTELLLNQKKVITGVLGSIRVKQRQPVSRRWSI